MDSRAQAQEDAYFYGVSRELIERKRQPAVRGLNVEVNTHPPAMDEKKPWSLYDFIDEHLQPDEHWIVDL